LNIGMLNLLFDTPWWLPTLFCGVGAVLFRNGNRRQEAKVRNIGLLLLGCTVALLAVSYFVDTQMEKCLKASRQLCYNVQRQDWNAMRATLDPNVAVALLGGSQLYSGREQTVRAAQDSVARFGLRSVRILGSDAEQTGSIITITLAAFTEHDNAMVNAINSDWEFEWQQVGGQWSLVRITCLRIGNRTGESAGQQFPRPR
jgi:hypothetical protein